MEAEECVIVHLLMFMISSEVFLSDFFQRALKKNHQKNLNYFGVKKM